jgi:hypothetical protein
MYGIQKLKPEQHVDWHAKSRGIVLTLHDFAGQIELIGNTIKNNHAFIPSAIASNAQKFSKEVYDPIELILPQSLQTENLYFEYFSQDLNTSVFFLNHFDPATEGPLLSENYESVSAIYIKEKVGKPIIFEDNLFQGNVGLFGGAVHIEMSPHNTKVHSKSQLTESQPFILMRNNTFDKNMAYFEANAVFIKNFKLASNVEVDNMDYLNLEITNCTFTKNFGMLRGNGAALVVDGNQN